MSTFCKARIEANLLHNVYAVNVVEELRLVVVIDKLGNLSFLEVSHEEAAFFFQSRILHNQGISPTQ